VKKPNWLRWGPDSTKSDDLKKVRQRTDQIIKRQEAQKELQGDGQEEASELIRGQGRTSTASAGLSNTNEI
jgi:hypothetical protein